MSDAIGMSIIIVGVAFNVCGCIGLVRLPDIYNRLQAATKCVTLGTCLVLAGSMIIAGNGPVTGKCIVCLLFVLITAPTAAHALALGAHASGTKLWSGSVRDRFQEDGQPGVETGNKP